MMNKILLEVNIYLPQWMELAIKERKLSSYNLGFFGGYDLSFINKYCENIFSFISSNDLNNPDKKQSKVDCNVFFEQVFFSVMADNENVVVQSVLGRPVNDCGYAKSEFCNLNNFNRAKFHHILGGNKRDFNICIDLSNIICRKYPTLYLNILSLFPNFNKRFSHEGIKPLSFDVETCLSQYEGFLDKKVQEWKDIKNDILLRMANLIAVNSAKSYKEFEEQNFLIERIQYFSLFVIPENWNYRAKEILKRRLHKNSSFQIQYIAIVPSIKEDGIMEVVLSSYAVKLLSDLDKKKFHFKDFVNFELEEFTEDIFSKENCKIVKEEITYLIKSGLIILRSLSE